MTRRRSDDAWLRPPLVAFRPTDLATFRASLRVSAVDAEARTASWALSESIEDATVGTVTAEVLPEEASWRGVITWSEGVSEDLLVRALWCVCGWLGDLRVEDFFLPARLEGARAVALRAGLRGEEEWGGERGYFASRRRTGTGLLYLSPDDRVLEENGVIRRHPSSQAWLVVESEVAEVFPSVPTGRLLAVQIVPPRSMSERIVHINANRGFALEATHTRVGAVRVLEQLSTSLLYGPHGVEVERVHRAAGMLDATGAAVLAAHRSAEADLLYGQAWARWTGSGDPQEYARVLSAEGGSPINHGFTQVSALVTGRSPDPIVVDDGEEQLPEPWNMAQLALMDAAMAWGAPHLLRPDERAMLLQPFEAWEREGR